MAENRDVVFRIVTTPNPTEIGLSVEVRNTLLANNPGLWPTATGTIKYSDFSSKLGELVQLDQAYAKGFGDYVFTYGAPGSSGAESPDGTPTTILYFAKNKTDDERNTPFKVWYTKKDWTFPEVISGIQILRVDSTDDQSSSTFIPKFFGLAEYVGPCVFKIEQFLSEVPWNSNSFQASAPQPQPLEAYLTGNNGTILKIQRGRCLHPLLKIRNPYPQDTTLFWHTGLIPRINGETLEYIFPPTLPQGRVTYIQSDEQSPVQGQYLRERATVYPSRVSIPLAGND